MTPERLHHWHRLFGITLTDLFSNTPWRVELEKDLALQRQLLDVVIIEQTDANAAPPAILPDGLAPLRPHNLLTYKSRQEALDAWAIDELFGHYVNYRKLLGPPERLRPETDFQLYAVATRYPQGLVARLEEAARPGLQPTAWPGVYDLPWGARTVRVIVLNAIAPEPRNAAWELFSTAPQRIQHGAAHYPWRRPGARELLHQLYLAYALEEPTMAYTMEQFIQETHRQWLHSLTAQEQQELLDRLPPEDRLRGLSPEEIFQRFTPEDRLRGLGPEDRLRGLGPEDRLRGLGPEDRLRGLGPEELQRLQEHLKTLH